MAKRFEHDDTAAQMAALIEEAKIKTPTPTKKARSVDAPFTPSTDSRARFMSASQFIFAVSSPAFKIEHLQACLDHKYLYPAISSFMDMCITAATKYKLNHDDQLFVPTG